MCFSHCINIDQTIKSSIIKINKMMRFNRGFLTMTRWFGSAKPDESIPQIEDWKQNRQIRDRLHLQFLSEEDKQVLYEQSRVRKTTALYNIMSKLPNSTTSFVGNFLSDSKVTLKSDNLYLPRISKNGVPIYDTLRAGKVALLLRGAESFIPLYYIFTVHYPVPMLWLGAIAYFGMYRPVYNKLLSGLVLKMELCPETQEILYQKAGHFGYIKTSRVKITDLQYCDRTHLGSMLYKFTRSTVDRNIIFRVKSTGQLLLFDPDGIWYEEGINHQLLI